MAAISLRLSEELETRLATEAEIEGKPRSEVLRQALADYLHRRERERFMEELVAKTKIAHSDPAIRRDALAMAEEVVTLDNEALDIAEGRRPGDASPEDNGENPARS